MTTAHRTIAAVLTASLAITGITACGKKKHSTATANPYLECDAEDRVNNEQPDCGFKHGTRFYQWSWVAQGKSESPAGWGKKQADAERKAVTGSS